MLAMVAQHTRIHAFDLLRLKTDRRRRTCDDNQRQTPQRGEGGGGG